MTMRDEAGTKEAKEATIQSLAEDCRAKTNAVMGVLYENFSLPATVSDEAEARPSAPVLDQIIHTLRDCFTVQQKIIEFLHTEVFPKIH